MRYTSTPVRGCLFFCFILRASDNSVCSLPVFNAPVHVKPLLHTHDNYLHSLPVFNAPVHVKPCFSRTLCHQFSPPVCNAPAHAISHAIVVFLNVRFQCVMPILTRSPCFVRAVKTQTYQNKAHVKC